jgi:hypothetical protein
MPSEKRKRNYAEVVSFTWLIIAIIVFSFGGIVIAIKELNLQTASTNASVTTMISTNCENVMLNVKYFKSFSVVGYDQFPSSLPMSTQRNSCEPVRLSSNVYVLSDQDKQAIYTYGIIGAGVGLVVSLFNANYRKRLNSI